MLRKYNLKIHFSLKPSVNVYMTVFGQKCEFVVSVYSASVNQGGRPEVRLSLRPESQAILGVGLELALWNLL